MTEVRIRNVEDWAVSWHRHQAKLAGHSLEIELRRDHHRGGTGKEARDR